jgi:hypothetical protein
MNIREMFVIFIVILIDQVSQMSELPWYCNNLWLLFDKTNNQKSKHKWIDQIESKIIDK